MKIVSQDGSIVVPFSGAMLAMKDAYNTEVIALMPNGNGAAMAQYGTYERAKTVLKEVIANEANGGRFVYYFPEE